jgi:hypothetical protein
MDPENQARRLKTFVLGGLVGASAALAAAARRRRQRDRPPTRAGLSAFEDAPCFHEIVQKERR